MFTEGEDVLMRGSDGLLYFGVLVDVEQFEALVRFGDGTEKTTSTLNFSWMPSPR